MLALPNITEAVCPLCCSIVSDSDCRWSAVHSDISVEKIGLIGSVEEQTIVMPVAKYCEDGQGKCQRSGFPTGYNGQSCTARDQCSFTGFDCNNCAKTGVWDAYQSQCVSCNGERELWVRGNTSTIYAGCSFPSGCTVEGIQGPNYGKCESACGADPECDEKTYGSDVPVTGGVCDYCDFIADPEIDRYPGSFTFTAGYGGSNPTNQGLEIWNSGPSTSILHWSVSDNASWLTLSPTSGTSFGEHDDVWLSVDISGLNYGTHTAIITISDPDASNSPRTVPVTLIIKIPNLQISDIYEFGSDGKVNYSVHNAGDWYTPEDGFYNSLYVDGVYEDYEFFPYSLAAGAWWDNVFSDWTCTPYETHTIKVCADERNGSYKMVAESNENDNCTTVNLPCSLECTGSINASPETDTAPCDYSIDIYNVDYCQGLTWEVTRDNTPIDSGTVTGETNWDRTIYDYGVGVDSSLYYILYINDDEKDYDKVVCQEGVPATCAEAGGVCKESSCSNYLDCSPAAENYDCSGATPYCCLGSCTAPDEFDFIISVEPASGSVNQGDATSPSTVTAALISGTTQNVSFYISSGMPSGASASFVPSSCNPTCSSSMTISTSTTTPSGTYQLFVCGTNGSVNRCYSYYELTVLPSAIGISPPQVTTLGASELDATSATLNGTLNSLGYDPATCPNCQCLVWFEYGTSGTEGVSGSYGNSTDPVIMTGAALIPPVTVSGLTPDTPYYFEAFAKNGGSW